MTVISWSYYRQIVVRCNICGYTLMFWSITIIEQINHAKIRKSIREQVLKQWLQGTSRDEIIKYNDIWAGTVSAIIKDAKQKDIPDLDLLKEVDIVLKNYDLSVCSCKFYQITSWEELRIWIKPISRLVVLKQFQPNIMLCMSLINLHIVICRLKATSFWSFHEKPW